MKITNSIWFTLGTGQCIGIVTIKNEVGQKKAYIGLSKGLDAGLDSKYIAENGTPVRKEILQAIANYL